MIGLVKKKKEPNMFERFLGLCVILFVVAMGATFIIAFLKSIIWLAFFWRMM